MTERGEGKGRSVTPLQATLLGSAVLAGGAVLTGAVHYTSTAKKLAEEGVPPTARLRAFPLAAQALGVSTLLCAGLGVAALVSWKVLGLNSREVAEVATFMDAVALVKQQREVVSKELRASLMGERDGPAE